ncbi:MAG: acyl-(acyl-carrier-protein)--UDP-N-acetylglucosamine O-acyltransferase [Pseudomonadota bacterium]|jgi:UDP-N-acetylglucosamine acyltransferase
MSHVHPSAWVAPEACLADDVVVGPFAVIEAGVSIGPGCVIDAHAVIRSGVRMGSGNRVHPHAVLGDLPQDLGFKAATETWLDIGDGNVFREGATLHRATQPGQATVIGHGNYIMNNAHIAHDCQIGDHNIFANGATLGGHCHLGDRIFLGGGVMVHQFCRIGSFAMLQGLAGINRDVLPFTMVGGRPGRHYRLNLVGMRRGGVTPESLRAVSSAFRALRRRESLEGLPDTAEMDYLRTWLAAGSRRGGYLGFFELATGDNND